MFQFISNIPISRRLFIAFALATVIPGIIVASLGVSYISALNARSLAVKTSFDAQNAATDEQISLGRMNSLLQARFAQVFALNGNATPPNDTSMYASTNLAAAELSVLEITFDGKLRTYQQSYDIASSANMAAIRHILLSDNPNNPVINEQHTTLDRVVTQQWVQYKQNQDKVLDLLQPPTASNGNELLYIPDYTTTYQALFDANNAYLDLKNSWQTLVDDATKVGTTVTNISGASFTTPLIGYTVTALLLTVLIILATGYIINLTITQPLRQLVLLTKRIARGETNARAEIKGHDEIYSVAISMNNMLEYIVRLVQEAQDRHDNLKSQIQKLVNEVSGLGAGDLTVQAEVAMDELGVMAAFFNYVTQQLGSLVVHVKTLANEVGTATRISFDSMAKLVESADQQIQQIVAAVAEVSDMATSSRNVAERAQILSDIAHKAHDTAQGGRVAVQQTFSGIKRISQNVRATSKKVQVLGERSREIGNIVTAMSDIAHQTNRLALDASVQAAMAGEHGTAFAAVATDIRSLAERSKEQALMIGQIVRTVLEDINSTAHSMKDTESETVAGSLLIDKAGQALDSIFSVVEQQASEIVTINQVAIKQLQSSNAVVQIMQNVSISTQQSNITTRETSQRMEHVTRLAGQLYASVHVFKVREGRMQQGTSTTRHGFPGQKQFDRTAPNTSQQATIGSSAQPLRQNFPVTPIPETPLQPQQPRESRPRFAPIPETPLQPQQPRESRPRFASHRLRQDFPVTPIPETPAQPRESRPHSAEGWTEKEN